MVYDKTQEKLLSGKALLNKLQNIHDVRLRQLQINWEKGGRRGPEPKQFTSLEVAELLNEYIVFCLFNEEENQKLAMYIPEKGIYSQNEGYIKYIVSVVEPNFNEARALDVIYHLRNMTFGDGVREKTRKPHLIPVENGIYNRQTGKLEEFTPKYVFTTKIDTRYVENAKHPDLDGWHFDDWLNEIACEDKEISQLLWEVINDALNGNYTRKKAFFLIGTGNNGKGTYQELLMNIVGRENVGMLKANEFEHRFALEAIKDKSLVVGDDVPPNVYIKDLSNFKSIITGDPVSIEGKNKPIYHDVLTPTIIQSTNGMPKSLDKSNGLLRRIVIVPFLAEFTSGKTENTKIKEVYLKDKQLLEYVLFKAIQMNFDTFTIPVRSLQALDDFKRDNDPIYEFKNEIMDNWEVDIVPKHMVFDVYKFFCEESGYHSLANRKFHKELSEHLIGEWDSTKEWVSNSDAKHEIPLESYKNAFGIDNGLEFAKEKAKTQACYVKIH